MFGSWLSYSHARHCLHHFHLLRWPCSYHGDHQRGSTYTNAEHLHKPINFTDIGIRCIDDSYLDSVALVTPEVPFTPEEDWDVLIGGVRFD